MTTTNSIHYTFPKSPAGFMPMSCRSDSAVPAGFLFINLFRRYYRYVVTFGKKTIEQIARTARVRCMVVISVRHNPLPVIIT